MNVPQPLQPTGHPATDHRATERPATERPTGERSPLAGADWRYVEATALDDFTPADWTLLNNQRGPYYAEQQAAQALRLLSAGRDDPTFGYRINNYGHCLQAATMAMRDGCDEEDVVVALLHDIGFVTCPDMHGAFAAALLGAYVAERNSWMLRHHGTFQQVHCHDLPSNEPDARERWRGHPHFAWTERFVARYDQNAMDADYDNAPLATFLPMVQRIFARPPKPPVEQE